MTEMARLIVKVKKLLSDAESRYDQYRDDDSMGHMVALMDVLDLIELKEGKEPMNP